MTDPTNSRKLQLEPTVDATAVRPGVDATKKALGEIGQAGQKAGEDAADGLDKIPAAGKKAATQIERDTKSLIGSIERATAAFKAGSRGSSEYFEELGKQRGVSGDALKPYIEQLRAAEMAQKTAAQGLGKMEVSAKQTAAALRGVPAQFTDIVTALQGGQQPLTVFLQQGGQLKDMFGGAGAAARALGGYVAGLINPFTLAAAAVGGLGFAYLKGAAEAEAFQRTLILTGNAAGATAQQLSAISASIAGAGVTQGAAAAALNQLAETGKVGADNLGRFAAAAVQLQRVGGPAVEETVKAFAELGKAPLQASLKLNESTNFLTAALYEQIKALEEQGRTTEAARVAQEAFAESNEQRIPQLAANVGLLEQAWLNVKNAVKGAGDALLDVGRATPDTKRIEELRARIAASSQANMMFGRLGFNFGGPSAAELDELSRLEKKVAANQELAKLGAEQAKATAARAEFDKIVEQNLDKQVKLKREIERIENLGLAAGKTRAEIETQIAAAREKARDKSVDRAGLRALEQEASLLDKLAGLTSTYTEDLKRLQSARQRGALTEQQYVDSVNELIKRQPFAVDLAKQQAEAYKQVADAEARGLALHEQRIKALDQSADAATKQVQAMRDEAEAAAIAAHGQLSLAQAIQEVVIARLQEQQRAAAGDEMAVATIEREIKARRELIKLIGSQETRDAAKKAAEDSAKEWKRASEEIERSITDSLMRGFENGKGFAETLRDTVVNMFKTLVLRPVIQAVVQPLAGNVLSALGMPGLGAAGGASGVGGGLGSLGGIFSGLSGGGLGLDLVNSSLGQMLGLSSVQDIGGNLIAGPTSLGNSLLGNAGNIAGYGNALYSLSQGQYGAAAGSALGTWFGGPIGAAIGGEIGKAVDKIFSGGAGTPHMGADWISTATGGYRPASSEVGIYAWGDSVNKNRSAAVEDALKVLTGTGSGLLNTLSAAFGQAANYAVGGYFAADGRDPAQANTRITVGGNTLSSTATRYGVSGAQEGLEAFTAELAGQVRAALRSMDIPEWAQGQLDALASSAGFEELANAVQNIVETKAALEQLVSIMPQLAGASDQVIAALLKQAGGIQNLQAITGGYFQAFYSDAEKTALATDQLRAALGELGFSMPASREAYRALVEAQDKNTEAGRAAWLQLQQLGPAFAALVPATEALGDAANETATAVDTAAEKMAEAGRRALAQLAEEQGNLQVELLRAQGDLVGAAQLARQQALAKLTEGLSAQDAAAATAAYTFNDALREQIEAFRAASAAAEAETQRLRNVAAERASLEQRLLQLQGDTAALRKLELDATDAGNRAILERIFALEDSTAAEQAAAAAQASIANERESLVTRLLQAQGNTAALRERELAALDPANRALLEQIHLLEDQKAAAQAAAEAASQAQQQAQQAAQAAEQLRQSWQSVTDSLFAEARRIRGLNGANSPQSLTAAQALFATTTAQARAGDQEAAKLLPSLSEAMLSLAQAQLASAADLRLLRAQTAASLSTTASQLVSQYGLNLPKLHDGTNNVPTTMAAILHPGEAVVPRAFNPALSGSAHDNELLEELRGLRADQRVQAAAMVRVQSDLFKLQKKWDQTGLPQERQEVPA